MGATSTQGVGNGSAEGLSKGSEHMSLGVKRLIGPHPVFAGSVTLAAGLGTLVFPLPDATIGNYVVITTPVNSAAPTGSNVNVSTAVKSFTCDTTGLATLVVKGPINTDTDSVNVIVYRVGIA